MLAEDLAAVHLAPDGSARVEPGVCSTRLWTDSLRALGLPSEGLARVRPELGKFLLPAGDGQVAAEAAPLHTLYALSTHNGPDLVLEDLPNTGKFGALLEQTWMKVAVKRMGLQAGHFRRATTLADRVRGRALRRPTDRFLLKELADRVEADFTR